MPLCPQGGFFISRRVATFGGMKRKDNHTAATLAAVGLAAFALWQLGLKYLYAYRRFSYKVDRLRVVPSGGGRGSVQLYLLVANPTAVQVAVDAIAADVFFNGTRVGAIAQSVNRVIYPRAVTQLVLAFDIDTAELFNQITDDIRHTVIQAWSIGLQGSLWAEGQEAPLDLLLTTQAVEQIAG